MDLALQEGQKRLEEKRKALLPRTDPIPISSLVRSSLPADPDNVVVLKPEDQREKCLRELREVDAKEAQERKERLKRVQIVGYLNESCLGERFRGLTFADYLPVNPQAAQNKRACEAFSAGFTVGSGQSLIMVGSSGTGKNMLSAIVGQELIERGFSFLHTSAFKIVRRYKDSWKQTGVTEESVLRYFATPDLLVIDEIGVQFGTPSEQLYLTELINDRYEALKSTVLLSNLTLKEIEGLLGPRCMERFHEHGSRVLVFNWSSYRRQAGNQGGERERRDEAV